LTVGGIANAFEMTSPNRRTFLILLGRGVLQEPSKGIDAMIHLVRDVAMPQDYIAVMAWNRATDFTTDRERLISILERFKKEHRVWIIREPDGFYALFAKCTHLGCTPRWLVAENKFKCPCHGSGFYRTGVNFEGPAPRPLERARIVLADDGQLLVDKSVKFQEEKGEWTKAESFLKA
jgi:Rieske Fe-S protein